MIRNVIFDVGKVLVSYEPDEMMDRLGYSKEQTDAVNRAMFEHKLWDVSDRGTMTKDELLAAFIENEPSYKDEIIKAYENIGDTIEMLPHAMEWISDVKKRGYKVYILSNYAEHTYEHTKEKLQFLPMMDGVVFSYACKQIKPDMEIYEELLHKYDLKPEECVFIDDRPVNIEGGEKAGIRGIVFKSYEQASGELNEMLK